VEKGETMSAPDKCPSCQSLHVGQFGEWREFFCGSFWHPNQNKHPVGRSVACYIAQNKGLLDERDQLRANVEQWKAYAERLEQIGDCLYENSEPTRYCLDACKDRKMKEMEQWLKAKETKP